nr:putative malate dehydrogenase 1B [Onthophagus taurus]
MIEQPKGQWEFFLHEQNQKNNWNHRTSPLIWKEVARRGGKAFLIGGISEFWEYVYDYYGLEAVLPKDDLDALIQDNMAFYQNKLDEEASEAQKIFRITINGIKNPIFSLIVPSLLNIPNIRPPAGLLIRLFDMEIEMTQDFGALLEVMEATSDMTDKVEVVGSLQHAFDDCDLFIDIDQDYARKEDECMDMWLIRNMSLMAAFGDAVNGHAKRDLKIILAHPGPCCFNGTLLAEYCTAIKPSNIIAISADKGSLPLSIISKLCKVPLDQLSAPPVWGLWLTPFIDVGSVLKRCDIQRPYQRAIKTDGGSTLPLGRITPELHYIHYMSDEFEEELWNRVNETKETVPRILGRPLTYAKAMATIKVLEIWFSGKPSDEIISLGIISNGSFGFPAGLCLSQPANFDGNSWSPFKNFPISDHAKIKVDELVSSLEELFTNYHISSSFYIQSACRLMI